MRTTYVVALVLTYILHWAIPVQYLASAILGAAQIAEVIRPVKVKTCSEEQVLNYECGEEVDLDNLLYTKEVERR